MNRIELRRCLRNRAELILANIRMTNSGMDIHATGNMRQVGYFIVEQCQRCDADLEVLEKMTCRLEAQCVEFFKKKYCQI